MTDNEHEDKDVDAEEKVHNLPDMIDRWLSLLESSPTNSAAIIQMVTQNIQVLADGDLEQRAEQAEQLETTEWIVKAAKLLKLQDVLDDHDAYERIVATYHDTQENRKGLVRAMNAILSYIIARKALDHSYSPWGRKQDTPEA